MIFYLPIRTTSEANSREHWHKKAQRHQSQKKSVKLNLAPHVDQSLLPCKIKLTRVSPRKLDRWENLPMSQKYILDAVCELLVPGKAVGQADSDSRIKVEYDQKKGETKQYAVIIEITQCSE